MHAEHLIRSLERFADVLPAVAGSINAEDARWGPDESSWSIVEIVAHMADEEMSDFRVRLGQTLRDPTEKWSPIDPEGWARERNYQGRDLDQTVDQFVAERRRSVAWLRTITEPQWDNAYSHRSGAISAGDLLASWAAHDALHLRQIAKRLFQLVERDAGQFSTAYAGSWTA